MAFFKSVAFKPIDLRAAWNFLPPLSAVINLVSIPLIAVPATSGAFPKEIKLFESAAAAFSVSPNCFATPPIRPNVLTILLALAGLELESSLMASPKLPMSLIGILYTFANFAMASPLSSADISNATDILAMVVVKSLRSSSATPN